MAAGLIGSEILKIAAEIRTLVRSGEVICNLTVGDFDPAEFPIPNGLREAIVAAYARGETNYPPADGVLELREAVQAYYQRGLGLGYPLESVLITGGARPIIYSVYRTLVDPGDRVVYPLPSWNNNHYVHLVGAQGVEVPCRPEDGFLPTAEALAPALVGARLLALNSPLNPTGTAIGREHLAAICRAILAENRGREQRGERPLFLMYDHIYWPLCLGETRHVTPPAVEPEMAKYTIFVDGISKAFASTGLRVGWAVGPTDVIARMAAVVGHVGAWAPRPEQVATASFLRDDSAQAEFRASFLDGIQRRLHALFHALDAMRADGLSVEALPPQGAIYLTARIAPFGQRTPNGTVLRTNEDIRRWMLDEARVGVVPFQAFGVPDESGWFRLSVGAASEAGIAAAMPRLARALAALRA
ncbi:MAG: aminotransferase class I/II-fold pyridoxal phosphate-dependent enzyme [Gemmatimonadaceae bacterium]|nr:aminotransferase class I/II-fold pyridoxal phosphate-dependent enzyme [Gemmatimonadaceae bacterium]